MKLCSVSLGDDDDDDDEANKNIKMNKKIKTKKCLRMINEIYENNQISNEFLFDD